MTRAQSLPTGTADAPGVPFGPSLLYASVQGIQADEPPEEREDAGPLRFLTPVDARLAQPLPHARDLEPWLPILRRLSVRAGEAVRILARATGNATSFAAEMLASGRVREKDLYRAIAGELNLPLVERIDPRRLIIRERQGLAALSSHSGWPVVMVEEAGGNTAWLIAPDNPDIAAIRHFLARRPEVAARLRVTSPTVLREALLARAGDRLAREAQLELAERFPELSARIVANAWQGACIAVLLMALPLGLAFLPGPTTLALNGFGVIAFLSCIMLRVCALPSARPLRVVRPAPVDLAALPVYTVLVALYREREVIPQLLVALGRLQWPRSKLEIKLVCESDDGETLAALRAHRLHHCVEVIEVPPGLPRTKPKALAYALPACGGDYVALYDAEDRPDPLQLVEAWQRFQADGGALACVQAPLVVTNGGESLIARLFAFEYAGLFRGLLPWLARRGLVLPLGGTSNHFRRDVLEKVGGWDPYNVTEDADLGLRLRRFGYRTGVISRPTLEDAPENLQTWLPQRTRWFKGWLHTDPLSCNVLFLRGKRLSGAADFNVTATA